MALGRRKLSASPMTRVASPRPVPSPLVDEALARIDEEVRVVLAERAVALELNPADPRYEELVQVRLRFGWRNMHRDLIHRCDTALYAAAAHMQLGHNVRARATLQRVHDAHAEFHAKFLAAYQSPRVRINAEFLRETKLTEMETRHNFFWASRSALEKMQRTLAEQNPAMFVEAACGSSPSPRHSVLMERAPANIGPVLTDERLSSDDVRRFVSEYCRRTDSDNPDDVLGVSASRIDLLRLMARLPWRLGTGEYAANDLVDNIGRAYGYSAFASQKRRDRLDGLRVDFMRSRTAGTDGYIEKSRPDAFTVERADSREQLQVRWRGLVRDAGYHIGATDPGGPLAVTVSCTREVLSDLVADGAELMVLSRDIHEPTSGRGSRVMRPSVCEGSETSGNRSLRRLALAARLETTVDGRQVECRAIVTLDQQIRKSDADPKATVERVRASTIWPPSADDDASVQVVEWSGAAVCPMETRRATGGASSRPMEQVLGDGSCSHGRAEWVSDGISKYEMSSRVMRWDDIVDDSLVLSCPCCLRRRVASVPAHRLPDDHHLLRTIRKNEGQYLDAQHAHEMFAGDVTANRALSIDELRARDGIVSLDLARYATAPTTVTRPPRPVSQIRTIGDAMRRR